MSRGRLYGFLYLLFILWLLLFPPWKWTQPHPGYQPFTASYRMGHHWRFTIPMHWEWSRAAQQSFLEKDRRDQTLIDYGFMFYEAGIGLVVAGLLFLSVPTVRRLARRFMALVKVECSIMRGRLHRRFRRGFAR